MTPQTFDRTIRAIKQVGFPIVAATALGFAGFGWINKIVEAQQGMAAAQNDFVRGMLKIEEQNSDSIAAHAKAANVTAQLLVDIREETAATAAGVSTLTENQKAAALQQRDTAERFERIITALERIQPMEPGVQ